MAKQAAETPQKTPDNDMTTPSVAVSQSVGDRVEVSVKPRGWRTLFDKTSIYGFELLMATFGLTVAAIVVDYGFFAFFNYIQGINTSANNAIIGEFSLWIVAAMLVWVPLATVFYLRTRGQLAAQPEKRQATLHKVLVSIYLFANVLIAAGALFAFLYVLIRLAVGAEDTKVGEVVVRVLIPSLLVVVLHGWMLLAYTNARKITRKLFAAVFAATAVVVMAAILISSVGSIRGAAMDAKKEDDLRTLNQAIKSYNSKEFKLPSSLDDVNVSADDLKLSLSNYTYEKKDTNKYELCTKFATDKDKGSTVIRDVSSTNDGYTAYPSFTQHEKGDQCFKLRIYGFNFPLGSSSSGL